MATELQELTREVAGLKEAQRGFGREIAELKEINRGLLKQISESRESNVRLEAMLNAFLSRTRDEFEALFDARNSHEQRISGIERDYVPKTDAAKLQQSIAEQGKDIIGLQRTESKALGIAGVISLVISAAAGLVGKYLWP